LTYNLGSDLVIRLRRKNSSGLEFSIDSEEHIAAYICKGDEKLTIFCIACYTHTFKCAVLLEIICDRPEMRYAATNKLINLRCLLLIDLPEAEILKSF
jgi:hypothetical protein